MNDEGYLFITFISFPYLDTYEMYVIIQFLNCLNEPTLYLSIMQKEWELAMVCNFDADEIDYPFRDELCSRKYIEKFWIYFNMNYRPNKQYDVIQYEYAFIKSMRVHGYDTTQFRGWKVNNNTTCTEKRKRLDDGKEGYAY